MTRMKKTTIAMLLIICLVSVAAYPVYAQQLPNNEGVLDTVAEGDTMQTNKGTVRTNYGYITNNWTGAKVTTNRGTIENNAGSINMNYGTVKTNYTGYGTILSNEPGGYVVVNSNSINTNRGTIGTNDRYCEVWMDDGGVINTNNGIVKTISGSQRKSWTVNTNNAQLTVDYAMVSVNSNTGDIDVSGGTGDDNRNGVIEVDDNSGEITLWAMTDGSNHHSYATGYVGNNTGTIDIHDGCTAYIGNNSGTIKRRYKTEMLYRPYELDNAVAASINCGDGFAVYKDRDWVKDGAVFSIDSDAPYEISVEGAKCSRSTNGQYALSNINGCVTIHVTPHTIHQFGDWTTREAATCLETGVKERACTICQEKETDTVPALGHNWSTTYIWSNDNKSVTATRTCKNDNSHIESETVNTSAKVSKAATYTSMGQTTYTAVFSNDAFEPQTKTVTNIAKLAKKAQPMTVSVSTKKVKVKKLKKKAQVVVPITVKNAQGKVTYKRISGNAKSKKALKINASTGKVTVKEKTKKGTYKLKVLVSAAGTTVYKSGSKTVTITVKVK